MRKNEAFEVLQGRSAGFVTRFFAFVVDLVVVVGILAVGGWLAVLVDDIFEQVGFDPRVATATIYLFLLPFIIGSYFVAFWALTGRTIGKWFMGLRVVDASGEPPPIGRAILRFLGYALSAAVVWVGYLWVIVDDERQAWHDHIAKTWVVYDYERHKGGQIYEKLLRRSDAE